jgi:hypothetical protein
MRSIAAVALVATVSLVTGCQIVPTSDNRFSLDNEVEITPQQVRFPIILEYPDNTDFFYPIYEHPPRSDLNLRGIDCQVRSDGTLAIVARVQNMGSDIIAAVPLVTTGDVGAFRVVATVSTANGSKEQVQAVQIVPLTVPATVILASNSTQALASDVTAIDVVADPDRYVPDPIRDNNRLSWKGTIDPANPRCTVERR